MEHTSTGKIIIYFNHSYHCYKENADFFFFFELTEQENGRLIFKKINSWNATMLNDIDSEDLKNYSKIKSKRCLQVCIAITRGLRNNYDISLTFPQLCDFIQITHFIQFIHGQDF